MGRGVGRVRIGQQGLTGTGSVSPTCMNKSYFSGPRTRAGGGRKPGIFLQEIQVLVATGGAAIPAHVEKCLHV